VRKTGNFLNFIESKPAGREVGHSYPSNADRKNEA